MIKIGAEIRDKIGLGMIVNMDFAQDDLERPNWSRYLACCLNFKINRFKRTTVFCPFCKLSAKKCKTSEENS